jgi:hypothetical protein
VRGRRSGLLDGVRIKEFDDAVSRGRANADAIGLTRRHCRHARIEPVRGNSMAGTMLGLPMGLLEVRCEHAPPPRTQGHQALEEALSFYEANCVGCPHRDGTGELPSLSTIATQRAAELAERQAAEAQAAEERARRHRERVQRRRQAVAGEGHVVRDLTRRIVEPQAGTVNADLRSELARVPWFLQRFRERWDASDAATAEAISFVVRRAAGDWGDEAADQAAEHLTYLASELPAAVALHVDGLLGAILPLCAPDRDSSAVATDGSIDAVVAAMERRSLRIRRDARRRRLAQTVGRCAVDGGSAVISAVEALFAATTGDEQHDRVVRTTMVDVLEEAVSPETLRDVLPITWSALLRPDQAVRSVGIDLWVACADVADALPAELIELSEALLQDRYVIVHRRMLQQLPRLHVPAEVATRLLPIVATWVSTYEQAAEPDALALALWALRSLAASLNDDVQAAGWYRVALAHLGGCRPQDRERLLTVRWPDELRSQTPWTQAALATAASPELIDNYNRRREPLLTALFDRPQLLADLPLAEIQPLSDVHGARHPWRALEPVELLQAAGRWADAAAVARGVEDGQPPGEEGGPGRRLAGLVARSAELAQTLTEGPPSVAGSTDHAGMVSAALATLEESIPVGAQDDHLRSLLEGVRASVTGAELLSAPIVTDPSAAADELDRAADVLAATPAVHASGEQRHRIASAWRIAVLLLRYDGAVRVARPNAGGVLQAVKRQAQVLHAVIRNGGAAAASQPLLDFLERIQSIDDAGGAQEVWQMLALALPPVCLWARACRRGLIASAICHRRPMNLRARCASPPCAVSR